MLGTRISLRYKRLFEISEVEITRVDCISICRLLKILPRVLGVHTVCSATKKPGYRNCDKSRMTSNNSLVWVFTIQI